MKVKRMKTTEKLSPFLILPFSAFILFHITFPPSCTGPICQDSSVGSPFRPGIAVSYSLSFSFCIRTFHLLPAPAWIAFALIAGFVGILARPRAFRVIVFFLFAIILCLSRRAHQMELCDAFRQWAGDGEPVEVIGKVISPPMTYYENYHFLLRIDSLPGAIFRCASRPHPQLHRSLEAAAVRSGNSAGCSRLPASGGIPLNTMNSGR